MEVDEWVQVSHGICCVCGKSFQNSPKPVLIFPIYNIGVVYHVYSVCRPIHCKKLLVPQKIPTGLSTSEFQPSLLKLS